MAGITLGAGRHMPRGFTGSGGTIVATRAVAANATVIEYHRIPAGLGDMAGIALGAGRHMA